VFDRQQPTHADQLRAMNERNAQFWKRVARETTSTNDTRQPVIIRTLADLAGSLRNFWRGRR
jgi:hypothetical protein